VIQVGPGLVLLPTVIYVFATAPTLPAVLFTIWCLVVALLDNVLKPLLLGRGLKVPMAVIFVGAIGGFLTSGIIGLFVGAVILTLGYELFRAWLQEGLAGAEVGPPSA
jgi:predicted PurR-regulated permease PerM